MFRRLAPLTLIVLSALVSCEREPELPPETVAVIGERTLSLDDFRRYLQRNPATELGQLSPEAASALLDQHIEEVLLSEYAATLDLRAPADRVAEAVRNDPGWPHARCRVAGRLPGPEPARCLHPLPHGRHLPH